MENIWKHHLSNFTHKLLSNPDRNFNILRSIFTTRRSAHSVNIRHKSKFSMPRFQTALYTRSFSYNAITLINSLPDEFRHFNFNKFKFKVKNYLLNKQNRPVNL